MLKQSSILAVWQVCGYGADNERSKGSKLSANEQNKIQPNQQEIMWKCEYINCENYYFYRIVAELFYCYWLLSFL